MIMFVQPAKNELYAEVSSLPGFLLDRFVRVSGNALKSFFMGGSPEAPSRTGKNTLSYLKTGY